MSFSKTSVVSEILGLERQIAFQQLLLRDKKPIDLDAIAKIQHNVQQTQLMAQVGSITRVVLHRDTTREDATRDAALQLRISAVANSFEGLRLRVEILKDRLPVFKSKDGWDRQTLMRHLVTDPNSVFLPNQHRPYLAGFPHIQECHCIDGFKREAARTGIPNCRNLAETALIKMILEKFHPDRPITLCSIASSGCAQEVVLHAKLVELGFKVNWVLADPVYSTHEGEHILEEFRKVTKLLNGGRDSTCVTLPSVDSISEKTFADLGLKPDAFIAIDLGQFGLDLFRAHMYPDMLAKMEKTIRALPYPHIYLHADKRTLEGVPPEAVLSQDTGPHAYRPTVDIEFIDSTGAQKKQVLGVSSWNACNYE